MALPFWSGDYGRRKLTEAARHLFVGQGYADTTMTMLVLRSGLARGTVYSLAKNKQEVLALAWDDALSELHQRFIQDRAVPKGLREQFRFYWGVLTVSAREDVTLLAFLVATEQHLVGGSRAVLAGLGKEVEAACQHAIDAGLFVALPPRLLIATIWAIFARALMLATCSGGMDEALLLKAEALAWKAVAACSGRQCL